MTLFKIRKAGKAVWKVKSESVDHITLGENSVYCWGTNEQIRIPVIGDGKRVYIYQKNNKTYIVRNNETARNHNCLIIINAVGERDCVQDYMIPKVVGIDIIKSAPISYNLESGSVLISGEEALAIVQPGTVFTLHSGKEMFWYTWSGQRWIRENSKKREARLKKLEEKKLKNTRRYKPLF